MGRYDFSPLRVHQTATRLLKSERISRVPSWYNVVASIPPSEMLVRTQPLQHRVPPSRRLKAKKPSKLFRPQKITYEEDAMRKEFFRDHPWELARPRIVLENDGKDAERDDWSKLSQPGRPLSGESVIQRQLWLLHNQPNMTRAKAYDQARKEFYDLRLQEDVRRSVAKEEAIATGAYFGKTALDIGMELENKQFEDWKKWAEGEVVLAQQKHAAMYTGGSVDPDDVTLDKQVEQSLDGPDETVPSLG